MEVTQQSECLEAYVGLSGLCQDIDAALMVNDIPGVELKTFSKVANSEDHTGKEMFLRLRREAARRVANDFLSKIESRYEITEIADRQTVGDLDTDRLTASGTFTLRRTHAQVRLRLEQAVIYADRDGSVSIQINEQDAYSVSVTAGYNDIYFEEVYGDKLAITIAGENDLLLASQFSLSHDCGPTASLSGKSVAKLTFSSVCDSVLCLHRSQLSYATRYMTVALLMEEVEYGTNQNPLARNSKESAGRIRARIMGTEDPVTAIPNKSLYWQAIGQAVKRTKLSGPCITCNTTRVVNSLP